MIEKPELVDEWRKAWKWASNWCFASMAGLNELYAWVYQFQQFIDEKLFHHIMATLCVLGVVFRLIKQPKNGESQ